MIILGLALAPIFIIAGIAYFLDSAVSGIVDDNHKE